MSMEQLFQQINDGLLICKVDQNQTEAVVSMANQGAVKLLGIQMADLIGKELAFTLGKEKDQLMLKLSKEPLKHWQDHVHFQRQGTKTDYIQIDYYPIINSEGVDILVVLRDMSYELRHLEKLKLFRQIYNRSKESLMIFDGEGKLEWVNSTLYKLTGVEKHWMIGMTINELAELYPKMGFWQNLIRVQESHQGWEGEIWHTENGGGDRVYTVQIFYVPNEDNNGAIVVMLLDTTELHSKNKEIEYLSYRDKLTGLFNLRYLMEQFEDLENRRGQVVYYIDLDGFTRINETFGHFHGDILLKVVGSRLMGNLKSGESVARVAGDKFALWGAKGDAHTLESRAHEILEVFLKPIQIDEQSVRVTVNLGFARYPDDGATVTELLKAAELASKHAKHRGLNRISAYDSELAKALTDRYRLDRDIKAALDKEEFYLRFQPVVKTTTGEVAGFEALARWKHGELGEISPVDFIPIAENNGAISAIGDWVLAESFSCIKTINDLREEPIYGAINVSIRQLEQEDFVKRVKRLMDRFHIEGRHIELEVTESVYMENLDAIFDNLKALNELGIRIAIDDFGTGYSALSQLFRLDVSKIKIDKSFIDGLSHREECDRLTEAITLIAKSLNLELVAEGVETIEQLDQLKLLKCDYIQGYLFSKPLSLGEFCRYLGLV